MNSITLALRLSLVGCLLPTAVIAQGTQWQTNQMQGMMTTAAVGIVVNSAAASSEVLIRSPGPVSVPPQEWSIARFGVATAGHPDYSKTALLTGFNRLVDNTPSQPPPLAVATGFGSISTGGDVCPEIDVDGRLLINTSWYFLSVTVGRRPAGQSYGQQNSVLRSLANPQQAILSYYLQGSSGISSSLIDSTVAEQTGVQLGFGASPTVDVAGVDWGMGAISSDPNGVRSLLFAPVRNRFYFTLTKDWITANPGFWVDDPSAPPGISPLDASTIYLMTWDSSLTWSEPTVAVSSVDLFGLNPDPDTEIDALSVFFRNSPSIMRVVLSTTLASDSPSQLLGYDRATMTNIPAPVPAQPLKTALNVLVTDKLALKHTIEGDIDNVDGTCGGDPEAGGTPDGVVGFPMSNFDPSNRKPLGLSVYRSITTYPDSGAPPDDRVDLLVTGIALKPNVTGTVEFWCGFPTVPLAASGGACAMWYMLGSVGVSPGSTTASLQYPGGLAYQGPVSFTAVLFAGGSPQPPRTSWITVLRY